MKARIPYPNDSYVQIEVESPADIENMLEASLNPVTPDVQAYIDAKYGTLEERQRKVAAAASAQDAVGKLDFDALRRDARAAAQMNPEGSRAALAALVETLIDVVEKLATMTKGN